MPEGLEFHFNIVRYLHHGDHAVVGNGIGADGKVPSWVPTDDPVNGVPVRRVRLVCIYNSQISHCNIHCVLWDLARKLQEAEKNGKLHLSETKLLLLVLYSFCIH